MEREFLEIADFLNEQRVQNFMKTNKQQSGTLNLDELQEHTIQQSRKKLLTKDLLRRR